MGGVDTEKEDLIAKKYEVGITNHIWLRFQSHMVTISTTYG